MNRLNRLNLILSIGLVVGIVSLLPACNSNVFKNIEKKITKSINATKEASHSIVDKVKPGQDTSEVENKTSCYPYLGCFPTISPWYSFLRPFPEPLTPEEIDVKLYFYTRNATERYYVTLWPNISMEGSDFNPDRPYTAFITHGFSSNGNSSWVENMKDAYLKKRDANIFLVDWGKGASKFNYLLVASNTRIVGAELRRFGQYLIDHFGLNTEKIHLMGHSLGAHISGYMAKGIPKIAQITAFDPAQPGFEGCPDDVRLTRDDAYFVDAIHTNARPFIPLIGFGFIRPLADIDYYMNGGLIQPGCVVPPINLTITSIADLGKIPVETISSWVSCSHGRSYLYYTEALLNDYCRFWGRSAGIVGKVLDLSTIGRAELILDKISSCSLDKCSPIGLDSQEYPARGVFELTTHAYSPYCQNDPEVTKKMEGYKSAGLQKNGTYSCNNIPPVVGIGEKIIGKIV